MRTSENVRSDVQHCQRQGNSLFFLVISSLNPPDSFFMLIGDDLNDSKVNVLL